jgi:hypothetical protein
MGEMPTPLPYRLGAVAMSGDSRADALKGHSIKVRVGALERPLALSRGPGIVARARMGVAILPGPGDVN